MKSPDTLDDRVNVHAAAPQLRTQVVKIGAQVGFKIGVLFAHELGVDQHRVAHFLSATLLDHLWRG